MESRPTPERASAAASRLPRAPHPTITTLARSSRSCPASPIGGNRIWREYRSLSPEVISVDGNKLASEAVSYHEHGVLPRRAQSFFALLFVGCNLRARLV